MTLDPRISAIDRAIAAIQPLSQSQPSFAPEAAVGGPSFSSLLKQNLDEVIELQNRADVLQQDLATGKASDINEVVLAVQQADLALTFAIELRNKVIDAYQEVSRMQV